MDLPSFPACIAMAAVISFMMEDTSSFGFAEIIFGVFVSIAYLWFVEWKRDDAIPLPVGGMRANSKLVDAPNEVAHKSRALGEKIDEMLSGGSEEDNVKAEDIARLQAKAEAQETLRIKKLREAEEKRVQAEAELAKKEAELKAQEEERRQKELEAKAAKEAEEALRLKQIEEARLQVEAEQAARRKEEEEAKERALEEKRIQKEQEEAARLQAEAEEAVRLQAELEEESRKQAEAETKRKAEEEAARIKAQKEEERKLQQIEQARAQAEAEQAARLQAEAEAKAKAEKEEAARHEAEEKERTLAEQELKDKMEEESMEFRVEKSDEFSVEKSDELSLASPSGRAPTRKSLETAFHGSMGYLANTDAAAKSSMSMRVRVLNETTGRSKDVIVPVTPDLTIEEAIYSNHKVRQAGVRKWPKELAQAVKQKTAEVVCLLLDPNTTNVMHTYSIANMKATSTETMHELAKPEWDQTVRMLLQCQQVDHVETAAKEVAESEDQTEMESGLFSVSSRDDSLGLEPKAVVDQGTPTTVDAAVSEDTENDAATEPVKAAQSTGGISPKGNASVDGDGAQSVSDGSTYSSKSISEKRRRKRELEAKRLSLTSPTSEAKPNVEGGGGFLSRFFARKENQENSPTRAT